MVTSAGVPTPTPEEMVRNVTSMEIGYHLPNNTNFIPAGSVTSSEWASVDAVRITLILQSSGQNTGSQFKGGKAQPLYREMATTITLRNRVN